jgi:thiosulfate reductase cytochrome b subunit
MIGDALHKQIAIDRLRRCRAWPAAVVIWQFVGFTQPRYIYGPASEVQQYAAVRFVFVPVIIPSGFWMYAGVLFALIGVEVWLGAFYLSRIGMAILSQVALFIARKTWLVVRPRRSN